MSISEEQRAQLLRPINARRVQKLDGFSHLAAYDVRAMLIRIFDFGGWSADLIDLHCLYEQETTTKAGKPAFKVAYRATVRLTVPGATYTEAAVGESTMPDFKRGDVHDMAIKTAESQAFKRCAINLGDQFGLGLYNAGSTEALIRRVIGSADTEETLGLDDHVQDLAPEDAPVEAPVYDVNDPGPVAAAPLPGLTAMSEPGDFALSRLMERALVNPIPGSVPMHFAKVTADAAKLGLLQAQVVDLDGSVVTLKRLIDVAAKRAREQVAS